MTGSGAIAARVRADTVRKCDGRYSMIITGASGFVGRQIVPILRAQGFDLLLVGRDPQRLATLFPESRTATTPAWQSAAAAMTCCCIWRCRTIMNVPASAFQAANVDLLLSLGKIAGQIGVRRFINLGSTHALSGNADDAYGASKAEGDRLLRETSAVPVTAIIAPAIYGTTFQGNLKIVERFPVSASFDDQDAFVAEACRFNPAWPRSSPRKRAGTMAKPARAWCPTISRTTGCTASYRGRWTWA